MDQKGDNRTTRGFVLRPMGLAQGEAGDRHEFMRCNSLEFC